MHKRRGSGPMVGGDWRDFKATDGTGTREVVPGRGAGAGDPHSTYSTHSTSLRRRVQGKPFAALRRRCSSWVARFGMTSANENSSRWSPGQTHQSCGVAAPMPLTMPLTGPFADTIHGWPRVGPGSSPAGSTGWGVAERWGSGEEIEPLAGRERVLGALVRVRHLLVADGVIG